MRRLWNATIFLSVLALSIHLWGCVGGDAVADDQPDDAAPDAGLACNEYTCNVFPDPGEHYIILGCPICPTSGKPTDCEGYENRDHTRLCPAFEDGIGTSPDGESDARLLPAEPMQLRGAARDPRGSARLPSVSSEGLPSRIVPAGSVHLPSEQRPVPGRRLIAPLKKETNMAQRTLYYVMALDKDTHAACSENNGTFTVERVFRARVDDSPDMIQAALRDHCKSKEIDVVFRPALPMEALDFSDTAREDAERLRPRAKSKEPGPTDTTGKRGG